MNSFGRGYCMTDQLHALVVKALMWRLDSLVVVGGAGLVDGIVVIMAAWISHEVQRNL